MQRLGWDQSCGSDLPSVGLRRPLGRLRSKVLSDVSCALPNGNMVSLSLRSSLARRSLGPGGWRECRDDVNVIGNTTHAPGLSTQFAANCRQIGVHAGRIVESSQGSRFFVLKMM